MSSDSEDDFFYTNTTSMLKALKKDISFTEQKNAPLVVENPIKNDDFNSDIIVLDNLDDNHSPAKSSKSDLDVSNNSCIILSDEELLSSSANLISKIDSVLVNGEQQTKSTSKTKPKTRSRRRGGRKSISTPTRITRQSTRRSKNFEASLATSEDSNDLQEGNYEVDVKVLWMSQYLKKFSIRRFDKVQTIFQYFSVRENIPEYKLIFTIEKNGVIVSKNDTPDSLNINAATIIEGGFRTEKNQSNFTNKQDKDGIQIKVQFKDIKRPLTVTVRRIDRLEVLMHKTAMELDVDVKNLKFYFDGELIKSNDTVNGLQLEGGECIDCIKYN